MEYTPAATPRLCVILLSHAFIRYMSYQGARLKPWVQIGVGAPLRQSIRMALDRRIRHSTSCSSGGIRKAQALIVQRLDKRLVNP